jgi:hypothetical protein
MQTALMDCGLGNDALQWLLDGFNATVVAFGQNGTGKTHSLLGTAAEPVRPSHPLPYPPSRFCVHA